MRTEVKLDCEIIFALKNELRRIPINLFVV